MARIQTSMDVKAIGTLKCRIATKPIAKAWNTIRPGHCLDVYEWWLGIAILNMIIDALVLILPMRIVWNLHMNMSKKVLVVGVLVCGYW